MRHVSKPGRAANAVERGAGLIVHVVDWPTSVFDLRVPAVCGAKPGGRLGWNDHATLAPSAAVRPVTCPKCLKVLAAALDEAKASDFE